MLQNGIPYLHEIAVGIALDGLSRAVLANEFIVRLTLRPRPLIGVATVCVSLHTRVSHEGHITFALVETPKGARVSVEILSLRA